MTQVGADQQMEGLINTAYGKITEMMFSPLNGTGTPSLSSLSAGATGSTSLLDRATTMLANNRQEAKEANERANQRPHEPVAGVTSASAVRATRRRSPGR